MKWKTLTKDAFPDIMKKKNIVQDYTKEFRSFTTRTITYRSKKMYIIAMNLHHKPDVRFTCYAPMSDDGRYLLRMFYAYHIITIDDEGNVIKERKEFYSPDSDGYMYITVDDENLEYCKYKTVKIGSIDD